VELAVPSGGTAPTGRRSYAPYGKVRSETGDLATDRGFLGQVEDATTGLSYLNARYYDTRIGLFISTDPIYSTDRIQTLNPYSYSVNNPTTYSDPGGRYSGYTFGLEVENAKLRAQNKGLIAHIGKLGNHIKDLQDVIRQQQRQINKLVTYARALEAEIRRQATIIQRLQERVAYLERVVVAQQREISRLRSVVARQARIIRYQAGVIRRQAATISYYRGVVNQLGFRLWGGTAVHASVMASIHSGMGIPGDAFANDRIAFAEGTAAGWQAAHGNLLADMAEGLNSTYSDADFNDIVTIAVGLQQDNVRLRSALAEANSVSNQDQAWTILGLLPIFGEVDTIGQVGHGEFCQNNTFGSTGQGLWNALTITPVTMWTGSPWGC
jgi:RHS repeat-associated protein